MALMATRSTSKGQVRAVSLVGLAAAVMMCVTACGKAGQRFKEGTALADCGQQIGSGSTPYLVNFTPGGVAEPDAVIELVANCDVGVQLATSDPNFEIQAAIHTKDGAYQAVAIGYSGAPGPTGALTVSQHGRRLGQMTLLTQYAPPSSGQPNFCDPLDPHNYGTLPKNYCPPGWKIG
jgi:hypothetical protein